MKTRRKVTYDIIPLTLTLSITISPLNFYYLPVAKRDVKRKTPFKLSNVLYIVYRSHGFRLRERIRILWPN